ncbi:GtrA family protein [Shewanella marinintestina]|uniref:GtrA family protein n=1 Tax=Shewanella marinintestina TaxID=190305 RepID=UPI00200CA375|nr:GtrA family protein [Shewanella marinintestina]
MSSQLGIVQKRACELKAKTLKRFSLQQFKNKFTAEIRFLTVGAGVFVFDAGVFYLLLSLTPLTLMSARVLAFAAAVVLSWYVNRHWTFKGRKHRAKAKQFSMSLVVASIAAIMNLSVFYVVNHLLKEQLVNQPILASLGFALGVLAGLIVNWLGANYWTFSNKHAI